MGTNLLAGSFNMSMMTLSEVGRTWTFTSYR